MIQSQVKYAVEKLIENSVWIEERELDQCARNFVLHNSEGNWTPEFLAAAGYKLGEVNNAGQFTEIRLVKV